MLLSAVWIEYEQDKRIERYAEGTIQSYKLQWSLLIEHVGDIPIENLETRDLKSYISQYYESLKPSSIEHRIKSMKSVLTWAHEEGITERHLAARLRRPKQEKRLPKNLTAEEIELLRISAESTTEKALVEFLYCTGCRISEIYALNQDDLNWATNEVRVFGKGSKERVVFFSRRAAFYLKRYFDERKDDNSALFVTDRQPHNRISRHQIRYILKRVATRAGIEKSVFPHRFRHTFSTHLIEQGAPVEAVQKMLGHASIDSTMVYTHVSNDRQKEVYNKCF